MFSFFTLPFYLFYVGLKLNMGAASPDINFVTTQYDWGNLLVGNITTPGILQLLTTPTIQT